MVVVVVAIVGVGSLDLVPTLPSDCCLCLSSSCRDVGLLLGKLGVVGLADVVVAVVVDGTRGGGVWFS